MTVIGRVTSQGASQPAGARALRVPPPLYYGAAFAAGMLLRAASAPLPLGARPEALVVAVVLLVSGTGLALAAVIGVVRNQTTIVPHHAVSALVTTGAYRITRNPMYTGLAMAHLGGALLTDSWWPLATFPFALLAVRRLVIDPEERYLANKFGQPYSNYQTRVRRWL
ncbi:MAG TPA: isoprenylcysteine carboxylmethyltransferase family protein [Dermatophilaceae bacterium]|jgi:protein-S-isoprenylcysteine O-methyltransferase Ste14